jgi:hypothetical protein
MLGVTKGIEGWNSQMIKLSHDEQMKLAHYVGVAAAFAERGYSEESIKLAFEQNLPEGIVKEAFKNLILKRLLGLGKGLFGIGSRQALKGSGRGSARIGQAVPKTGKSITKNTIFPKMIKNKSLTSRSGGVGEGFFTKKIGPHARQQPMTYGYYS